MPENPKLPGDSRAAFDMIEECRSRLRISKAELCRRADLSESTYTLLQQRHDRTPHRRTVGRLRDALLVLEPSALHPLAPSPVPLREPALPGGSDDVAALASARPARGEVTTDLEAAE